MNPQEPEVTNVRDLWRDEPKEFTALDCKNRKGRRARKAAARKQKRLAKAA